MCSKSKYYNTNIVLPEKKRKCPYGTKGEGEELNYWNLLLGFFCAPCYSQKMRAWNGCLYQKSNVHIGPWYESNNLYQKIGIEYAFGLVLCAASWSVKLVWYAKEKKVEEEKKFVLVTVFTAFLLLFSLLLLLHNNLSPTSKTIGWFNVIVRSVFLLFHN